MSDSACRQGHCGPENSSHTAPQSSPQAVSAGWQRPEATAFPVPQVSLHGPFCPPAVAALSWPRPHFLLPFSNLSLSSPSHLPHLRLRSYWPWSGHPACTLTTSTALRRTLQGWRSGFHLPCLTSRQPAPESRTVMHTGHSRPAEAREHSGAN